MAKKSFIKFTETDVRNLLIAAITLECVIVSLAIARISIIEKTIGLSFEVLIVEICFIAIEAFKIILCKLIVFSGRFWRVGISVALVVVSVFSLRTSIVALDHVHRTEYSTELLGLVTQRTETIELAVRIDGDIERKEEEIDAVEESIKDTKKLLRKGGLRKEIEDLDDAERDAIIAAHRTNRGQIKADIGVLETKLEAKHGELAALFRQRTDSNKERRRIDGQIGMRVAQSSLVGFVHYTSRIFPAVEVNSETVDKYSEWFIIIFSSLLVMLINGIALVYYTARKKVARRIQLKRYRQRDRPSD